MFSRRGQESAPFELLIAVIVMAFVMLFGYIALDYTIKEDCKIRINKELEKMRSAIESTTNQSSLQRVVFEVPQCFKDSRVRLDAVRDKRVCSSICREGREQCVALDYFSDEFVKRVCVNIPIYTDFEGSVSGGPGTYCPDKRSETTGEPVSYELTPFSDEGVGVPNGTYVLYNKTPPGFSKPVVCAYRMK